MGMIVCTKCNMFFHPKKNGVIVEEGMPVGKDIDIEWVSYKLWRADELECRSCGDTIIAGFARHPMSEHYMGDYKSLRKTLEDAGLIKSFVKDCP